MTNTTRVVALIPARSGSKGVLHKNIRLVGDKSLLQRAVYSAIGTGISDIFVSTDSQVYADIAEKSGARIIYRPLSISDDKASSISVINHFLESINYDADHLVLLEPTSPFRTSKHVSEAMKLYIRHNHMIPVLGVTSVTRNPYNILKYSVEENVCHRISNLEELKFSRRQDNQQLVRVNSAIYIYKIQTGFEKAILCDDTFIPYMMSARSSINIDSIDDLLLAKSLARLYDL